MKHYRAFNIVLSDEIDLRSSAVDDFLNQLRNAVPAMTEFKADKETGSIKMFDPGDQRRNRREVAVLSKGVLSAASDQMSPDEQREFTATVARAAAAHLGLRLYQLALIELRNTFRIQHTGNHHALVAKVLCSNSAAGRLAEHMPQPLSLVKLQMNSVPENKYDVQFAMSVHAQTSLEEIRTEKYDGDAIEVECGMAWIRGFPGTSFHDILAELDRLWTDVYEPLVRTHVVKPLTEAANAAEGQAFQKGSP